SRACEQTSSFRNRQEEPAGIELRLLGVASRSNPYHSYQPRHEARGSIPWLLTPPGMPKRTDLKKILLIGSGPIIIGQACEFDYSGTQACKALREEGYSVVLVNSNPATIMTDPDTADRTYVEPITWQIVAKIIEKERPDALLPTLDGQTGHNTAMDLHRHSILAKYGVEMIGARADVIDKAEDRQKFKDAMIKIGLDVPRSGVVRSLADAQAVREEVGLPCVLRPSFTLGGSGGGIAYNREEFNDL